MRTQSCLKTRFCKINVFFLILKNEPLRLKEKETLKETSQKFKIEIRKVNVSQWLVKKYTWNYL